MKFKFLVIPILLLILLVITVSSSTVIVSAQSKLQWSTPQRIRGYSNDADPPYLVADFNRTVHALGSQKVGNDLDIFYSQWTMEKQWTDPIDILLSPNSRQAILLGAFLDRKGMLHVAFYGGVTKGEIYYSRAPAVEADTPRAWSWPRNVGDRAVSPAAGTILGDEAGNLFILYNGMYDGNGLYEVHSGDGGDTWSDPVNVFSTNTGISPIQAILDARGRLHAVWTEFNKGGTGEAIYYARLDSDRKQWSLPLKIRTRRECIYEADWPAIVSHNDELIVLYNCDQPPHQWMSRSVDGGKTWAAPILVFPGLKGENGASALLKDSSNIFHALIPKRTDDERIHALWHSEWNGKQWTIPELAVPSMPTMGPSYIKGTISQGNVILVVMRNDLGAIESGPWYSYAVLNSPTLPTVPLPTPIVTQTKMPTTTYTPTLVPTTAVRTPNPMPISNAPMAPESNPTLGIVIAVFPVVLILIILAAKWTR